MTGSTLSVWKFDTAEGARRAVRDLEEMQRLHSERLLGILDCATVTWEKDKRPVTKQGSPSGSTAALGGAFWGMLVGLVFFVPMLRAAMGSSRGTFAGSMADVGIDDGFIEKLRAHVTPGTSALFLLTSAAGLDRVEDRLAAQAPAEPIHTTLSEAQDSALRRVFGGGDRTARTPGEVGTPSTGATDVSTTSLTVWNYRSAIGASAGEVRLRNLEEREALTVIDTLCVSWLPGAPKPRIARLRHGAGAARGRRGAVLGGLAAAMVLASVTGASAGARVGALAGRLRRTGIDEAFLEDLERRLVPGTSSLLVLSADADLEALRPVLERGHSRGEVTVVHALLRDDATRSLRDLPGLVPSYPSRSPVPVDQEPVRSPVPSQRSPLSDPTRPREETP